MPKGVGYGKNKKVSKPQKTTRKSPRKSPKKKK